MFQDAQCWSLPHCSVPMVYKHEPNCEPFLKTPQAKQWICRIGSADQEEADRLRSWTWQNPAQIHRLPEVLLPLWKDRPFRPLLY